MRACVHGHGGVVAVWGGVRGRARMRACVRVRGGVVGVWSGVRVGAVSYTHLRAHETRRHL
eukprot:6946338-Prorocentrum_lima.AAC.1